jgi:hypothetical protein
MRLSAALGVLLTAGFRLYAITLFDRNIAIDRYVHKPFHLLAGARPFNFKPVNFLSRAESQHDSRIVRRKIAAAANLHARAFQITRSIGDHSAHSVTVAFRSNQIEAEPVTLQTGFVLEKHWRSVIARNQNIHCAIIVEVAQREAPCG